MSSDQRHIPESNQLVQNNSPQRENSSPKAETSAFAVSAPTLTLPKGGGAIRGMGEKFAANPVTGTGSMSVPIAVSPGRGGFGPQLSLSYDSGAGNGSFGLGWNLSLPAITRKTDKGLPQYNDVEDADVFILSGAEDLVPTFKTDALGELILDDGKPQIDDSPHDAQRKPINPNDPDAIRQAVYLVRRYRPRVEGLFARIERWTNIQTGATEWRSITKDNITTWYGKTPDSRIADPANPNQVFSWLICESRDDKGNAILYEYKEEDGAGVSLAKAHEANRTRTANRYLKRIQYGNKVSTLMQENWQDAGWMFEVAFDYCEQPLVNPTPQTIWEQTWDVRQDAFSSYRSGFEVRTYRLCHRVLMFHHFSLDENQQNGYEGLVRSTNFTYTPNQISTYLASVTQHGYQLSETGYASRQLPPLEFAYSQVPSPAALANLAPQIVDADSLDNLPIGLDGTSYQWIDLDGDGVGGILTEQGDAWFYKRNLSPLTMDRKEANETESGKDEITFAARFAPLETVAVQPSFKNITGGGMQFMDLAGDGRPDLVQFEGFAPGFFEHTEDDVWETHRSFKSLPNLNWRDPNLKFIDLTGDGHADILISEDEVFTWYPSLAEDGFGASQQVRTPFDEEQGARVVFADATQAISLADMSGDGLTDIVRMRNGEVCYWPNLGYGRFGAKVTMDGSPWFDYPDLFDQRRIRLADIDGSGVTDIIYLHSEGVRLYFNQSGNSWSTASTLNVFPTKDNLSAITVTDLFANGTACLVWSSPLPQYAKRSLYYLDLMGGQKPHLMIKSRNNLGAETEVQYAPSTKFYLEDKYAGKPWITRLPFPVHVVERVITHDQISRNRFVTRYAYHHGYFDGVEREFRGFGMVEQWDTETMAALSADGRLGEATNLAAISPVPPIHTKTWFHTGAYFRGQELSSDLAREYVGAPQDQATFADWARDYLLADTVFPDGNLSADEQRQAVRALKGAMLRQEIYADDDSRKEGIPYTVTEQNFTIEMLQPQAGNRHAVFFTHPREAISYQYERNLADPRVTHALTLEVDDYGNVLKSTNIGYGRRTLSTDLLLTDEDKAKQAQVLVTFTENNVTDAVTEPDDYRAPLLAETLTYELTGYRPTGDGGRFQFSDFVQPDSRHPARHKFALIFDSDVNYERSPTGGKQRRLIEHVRTLYRKNDLTGFLSLNGLESRALPGESYKLALTPDLLASVFTRRNDGQPAETLLPNPAATLVGKGADQGGYVLMDGKWWIPSGKIFFHPEANLADPASTAVDELEEAQRHFFQPRKFVNPFDHRTLVEYDAYDLLGTRTEDVLGNTVTAVNDYRVLQPQLITDPNGNRVAAAFDALGLIAATAVMGKTAAEGDSLTGIEPDPTQEQINRFVERPRRPSVNPAESEATPIVHELLRNATTRIVYDLDRFRRSGEPPFAATIARETHVSDLAQGEQAKLQISFSYSDGFGREIQKKAQAEAGSLVAGGPVINPRWVGSGWTIFNNKGKPVRQYEPFFDDTHDFKFGHQVGVSPVLFYDPVERVIATLHPNHTYEKVVFDAWRQVTYDVNDTVTFDPRTDEDVQGFVADWINAQPSGWQTWLQQRGVEPHDPPGDTPSLPPEQKAAVRTLPHANTPTIAFFDTLGRTFLTIADNGNDQKYATRVTLDIEGNQRAVMDANGRIVMRYDYDMLGKRIHQASMEAGERWMLNNVAGNVLLNWNSRRFDSRRRYDELQRLTHVFVIGQWVEGEPREEKLVERLLYFDRHPEAAVRNGRGKVYAHYDQAGAVLLDRCDFKGNATDTARLLAREYKQTVDWKVLESIPEPASAEDFASFTNAALPLLEENGKFVAATTTAFDALNRSVAVTRRVSAEFAGSIQHRYNEAGLLNTVSGLLRGETEPSTFVADISYNAKGQREQITYGNGAVTTYRYDPATFRLINLRTMRRAGANGLSSLFRRATVVQDLHYTYDPAGNITTIQDEAIAEIIHAGQTVSPHANYRYDPVYRLIYAEGREHIGQTQLDLPFPAVEGNYRDYPFFGIRANPNDPQAMRNYHETYSYDEAGNILSIAHRNTSGASEWVRTYAYEEVSQTEAERFSNRLSQTTVLGQTDEYRYDDAHGNMYLPHLSVMEWDYRDQLQASATQVVTDGIPATTYYTYDASGERVRKVTENFVRAGEPSRKNERFYLGGFEIYREYASNRVSLERETLHVMDDKQRIALVETRTQGNDPAPKQLIRYQFGNHLGSVSLELGNQAQVISYEEYTPYGSTSYQVVRSQTETPKRYRYTGMERDEETGLNYHLNRYYAPWVAAWVSCDPKNLIDGVNLYQYVGNNPISRLDETGTEAHDSDQRSLDDLMLRALGVESGTEADQQFQQSISDFQLPFARELLSSLQNVFEPGSRRQIDPGFDFTSSFRVLLRGGREEYRPEEINEENRLIRDHMVHVLTTTSLPSELVGLAQETSRTNREHSAYITQDGNLGRVAVGEAGHTAEIEEIPENAIGYVHTHPTPSSLLAPPSGDDWPGHTEFSERPIQLVVEAGGRVWGVLEPRHATLLGQLTDDGRFEPLNPLDTGNQLAYEIVDEDQLRMEEFYREERERTERSREIRERYYPSRAPEP